VTSPSYEEAREALRARLGDKALRHCEAVADSAAALAALYDADRDAARLAGLLHDWCKETGRDDLLAAAQRAGIEITTVDRVRPYLLHGPVGAAELEESFPRLPVRILRAVSVHTFGAEDMTDLDRVVYVADMIEPHRTYEGVEELREQVGHVALAELMRLAYARSITHLIQKRKPLHPRTLAVWNALVAAAPVAERGAS
jgi:predicted HD superfamily hydrolase involved in NAD metabolism